MPAARASDHPRGTSRRGAVRTTVAEPSARTGRGFGGDILLLDDWATCDRSSPRGPGTLRRELQDIKIIILNRRRVVDLNLCTVTLGNELG
jgi:hypothetical protein